MIQVKSRKEALEEKADRYFTGKECKHGHVCERYISNGLCVECARTRARSYRDQNKEKCNIANKEWYNKNKDSRYRYVKEWRLENPNKPKEYIKNNSSRYAFYARKYQASKLNATPCWLTEEHLERIELFYVCAKENELTFGEQYHVDHVVPLQGKNICGLHVPWNLQVIPAEENFKKGNRHEY